MMPLTSRPDKAASTLEQTSTDSVWKQISITYITDIKTNEQYAKSSDELAGSDDMGVQYLVQ